MSIKQFSLIFIFLFTCVFSYGNNPNQDNITKVIELEGLNRYEISELITNWANSNANKLTVKDLSNYEVAGDIDRGFCLGKSCYATFYSFNISLEDNKITIKPIEVMYEMRGIKQTFKRKLSVSKHHEYINDLANQLKDDIKRYVLDNQ